MLLPWTCLNLRSLNRIVFPDLIKSSLTLFAGVRKIWFIEWTFSPMLILPLLSAEPPFFISTTMFCSSRINPKSPHSHFCNETTTYSKFECGHESFFLMWSQEHIGFKHRISKICRVLKMCCNQTFRHLSTPYQLFE